MSGIPRLDKNLALVTGASGAIVVLVIMMMGTPFSVTGYIFLAAGFVAMGWAAWSRVAAAYS